MKTIILDKCEGRTVHRTMTASGLVLSVVRTPDHGTVWCEVAVLKLKDPSDLRSPMFGWATEEVFEDFDDSLGGCDTVVFERARLPALLKHLEERS